MSKNPGYHRRRIGDLVITAIFDGTVAVGLENLVGVTELQAQDLQRQSFRPEPSTLLSSFFAITSGDGTALIDTGGARSLDEGLGSGSANMAEAGIDPLSVSRIFLTHLHSDHYGGLLAADGTAAFPNAELVLSTAERNARLDPPDFESLPDALRQNIEIVRRYVAPYRARLRLVEPGEEIAGIQAVALPGHTAGHTGWRITSRSERLLIWGDVVHFPAIQFELPRASLSYDYNPAQAAETRIAAFTSSAESRMLVAGMHHDFPCFGHLVAKDDHFAWVPDLCRQYA